MDFMLIFLFSIGLVLVFIGVDATIKRDLEARDD